MRVLALVPGGIGDQILFFPTLDDLKQHYSQAEVDVLVEPRAKSAYRVCQSVNQVLTFDFRDRNSLADWANLLGNIREREYDVVLSLGQDWPLGLLLWLTGIPTRIGYGGGGGEFFFTHPVSLKSEQYAAHMYHDLLQGLGITTPCPELQISVPKKDIQWAEAEQKRLGLLDGASNYILIHGGSQKDTDSYPARRWQQIIQTLHQRQSELAVVALQGPEDGWVAELVQTYPDLKVTAPEDVGKLAAMIAGASLILCTDSAAMHLAVAVKTYVIALLGATAPEKLLPKDPRFVGIKAPSGRIADIPPTQILQQILQG